jgi:cell division protease FtsH
MTFETRLKSFFLARLRREAIQNLYRRAELSGLMESRFIEQGNDSSGQVWSVTRLGAQALRINDARSSSQASSAFERALRRGGDGEGQIIFDVDDGIVVDTVRPIPQGRREQEERQHLEPASFRPGQLAAIRKHVQRPLVADAAVALLFAKALASAVPDLATLAAILRRPNPCIVIHVPVPAFERLVGRVIERGLIWPAPIVLVDAIPGQRLTEHYRDNPADPGRVLAFAGTTVREKSEAGLREALTKALFRDTTPIVTLDEVKDKALPERLLAAADLVAIGTGITIELIADLMNICLGIDRASARQAIEAAEFRPVHLGIDDLVAALRPGRSADAVIEALDKLDIANWVAVEEAEKEEQDKEEKRTSASSKKTKQTVTRFDITQPVARLSESEAADRLLLVESLAGYGEARAWALDLKSDIALWRDGYLDWSEMSTKLLLSGPPGTGKTTFARALCNTLQVPMLATSVAQWLEPGYLGDVLKLMSSAFEAAGKQRPAILFIDEMDGIGRRGDPARSYAEYWDSVINRALELLDGVNKTEGVIIVGATNHPDHIDPALRRSGRLERHVEIPLPDTEALIGILAHHLGADIEDVIASRPQQMKADEQVKSAPSFKPVSATPLTSEIETDKEPRV